MTDAGSLSGFELVALAIVGVLSLVPVLILAAWSRSAMRLQHRHSSDLLKATLTLSGDPPGATLARQILLAEENEAIINGSGPQPPKVRVPQR